MQLSGAGFGLIVDWMINMVNPYNMYIIFFFSKKGQEGLKRRLKNMVLKNF